MKPLIATAALTVAVIVGIIAYERMLWNECRLTNSWFYCVRVLGK
jgi:hypothetical protein